MSALFDRNGRESCWKIIGLFVS